MGKRSWKRDRNGSGKNMKFLLKVQIIIEKAGKNDYNDTTHGQNLCITCAGGTLRFRINGSLRWRNHLHQITRTESHSGLTEV